MDSMAGKADSALQRPSQPRFEVADVFRLYGKDYRAAHTLSPQQAKAMRAIERCRTEALGGHLDRCDHCGHEAISYNSCRNRNCPKCRGSQRAAWVEARELELLPIQYFHVVFTLPEALLGLSGYHPVALHGLLFQSAAETLQTFAANRWDAELGIVMVLHTWGQTLNAHPHVHCIVTGGALKRDGSAFVPAPKNFLFPVRALSRVFRGKYLAGLERLRAAGTLSFAGKPRLADPAGWQALRRALYAHEWVVYAKRPFAEPQHLIRYLGRYVNRIAIANHRLLAIEHGRVSFSYLDNRGATGPTRKTMTLAATEFIRRFLSHVPPRQFRRIRYYGLLANARRTAALATCRQLLGTRPDAADPTPGADTPDAGAPPAEPPRCPCCGHGRLRRVQTLPSYHDPPANARAAA